MRRLPRATVSPGASRHPAPPRSCDATSCRRGGGTRCSGPRRRLETHRGIFMSQPGSDLSRRLRSRHIQLIAIGGTVGVGLFLGSARAIHNAGPALVLAYALGGIAIFFIMRALGELLTYRPVAGSFATYADEFCGPFAGFVTGWSYWFAWIAPAMAELTAIGVYVRWWLPAVPQCLPALVALLALYGSNLLAVRLFGELEVECEQRDERSEEHTSELQSRVDLVCRLLLEKKK